MIAFQFDDNGERFVLGLSKKPGKEPKETLKVALALLHEIYERVVKNGRQVNFRDVSFAPYKSVVISPGERIPEEIEDLFDLLKQKKDDR